MHGLGALDTPAAPRLENWSPAKEASANAFTLPPLGRGGRLGASPDRIPKPTAVRWIPTTAI